MTHYYGNVNGGQMPHTQMNHPANHQMNQPANHQLKPLSTSPPRVQSLPEHLNRIGHDSRRFEQTIQNLKAEIQNLKVELQNVRAAFQSVQSENHKENQNTKTALTALGKQFLMSHQQFSQLSKLILGPSTVSRIVEETLRQQGTCKQRHADLEALVDGNKAALEDLAERPQIDVAELTHYHTLVNNFCHRVEALTAEIHDAEKSRPRKVDSLDKVLELAKTDCSSASVEIPSQVLEQLVTMIEANKAVANDTREELNRTKTSIDTALKEQEDRIFAKMRAEISEHFDAVTTAPKPPVRLQSEEATLVGESTKPKNRYRVGKTMQLRSSKKR